MAAYRGYRRRLDSLWNSLLGSIIDLGQGFHQITKNIKIIFDHGLTLVETFSSNTNFSTYLPFTFPPPRLTHPPAQKTKKKKVPLYTGIRFFNKLPHDIRDSDTISKFKRRLKLFLEKRAFYSTKEYLHLTSKDILLQTNDLPGCSYYIR